MELDTAFDAVERAEGFPECREAPPTSDPVDDIVERLQLVISALIERSIEEQNPVVIEDIEIPIESFLRVEIIL